MGAPSLEKRRPDEKHQKAIPMAVISALANTQISEIDRALVQLTVLGMFFAFWSCLASRSSKQKKGRHKCHACTIYYSFKTGGAYHTAPDLEFTNCISINF
jgi:hypothetical protein